MTGSETTCGENCADLPIGTCTSLEPIPDEVDPDDYDFQQQCRAYAEQYCNAVARTIERYYHKHKDTSGFTLPEEYRKWTRWAKNDEAVSKCRNLTIPFSRQEELENNTDPGLANINRKSRNNTRKSVLTGGKLLAAHEIDDWGQE